MSSCESDAILDLNQCFVVSGSRCWPANHWSEAEGQPRFFLLKFQLISTTDEKILGLLKALTDCQVSQLRLFRQEEKHFRYVSTARIEYMCIILTIMAFGAHYYIHMRHGSTSNSYILS